MQYRYDDFYHGVIDDLLLSSPNQNIGSQFGDIVYELQSQSQNKKSKQVPVTNFGTLKTKIIQNKSVQVITPIQKVLQTHTISLSSDKKINHQINHNKTNSKVVNFNKFLKTKTVNYLKMLRMSRLLSEEQQQALEIYQKSGQGGDKQEGVRLPDDQSLKIKCKKFHNSSELISTILLTEMNINRKIQIIKSLGKIGNRRKIMKKNKNNKQQCQKTS